MILEECHHIGCFHLQYFLEGYQMDWQFGQEWISGSTMIYELWHKHFPKYFWFHLLVLWNELMKKIVSYKFRYVKYISKYILVLGSALYRNQDLRWKYIIRYFRGKWFLRQDIGCDLVIIHWNKNKPKIFMKLKQLFVYNNYHSVLMLLRY